MGDTILNLPLVEWAAIAVMALAGSWMHFNIWPYKGKPDDPGWRSSVKMVGMFVVPMVAGAGMTPGLCEMYGLTTQYQRMIVAFVAAALVTPVSRGAVFVAESEAVAWLKRRLLGGTDDDAAAGPTADPGTADPHEGGH